MSDFYRNLLKSNVAFGAGNVAKPGEKPSGAEKDAERPGPQEDEELASTAVDANHGAGASRSEKRPEEPRDSSSSGARDRSESSPPLASSSRSRDDSDRILDKDDRRLDATEKSGVDIAERLPARKEEVGAPKDVKSREVEAVKQSSVDPVAAAKERYLARKRQRGL
jgi:hypothetical protein